MAKNTLRIAAVGDLHYGRTSQGALQGLFAEAGARADVLLLCGDLTDYGRTDEVEGLARDLAAIRIPTLAVFGNHDHEAGDPEAVRDALSGAGVTVLDGESCVIQGIGFAGTKGFGGGFGRSMLEPWGEPVLKAFVQEAIDEALKLERALARLSTKHRVALLHYAPIAETVKGEPPEIYPFLGSSRLEEPLNRFGVSACFHGHVHHGTPEGRTSAGVPVYNCALALLKEQGLEIPLRIVEIPLS